LAYYIGYAARIDFNPLAVKQFRLPADAKFVVAQSLAVKNKAASNDFNTRVVECRLASQVNVSCSQLEKVWHLIQYDMCGILILCHFPSAFLNQPETMDFNILLVALTQNRLYYFHFKFIKLLTNNKLVETLRVSTNTILLSLFRSCYNGVSTHSHLGFLKTKMASRSDEINR